MARIFLIAAVGIVVVVGGIFGYKAMQPPLKEQYIQQLRAAGGDFPGITRAECVFDRIVDNNGIETVQFLFDLQEVMEKKTKESRDRFDKKWKNSKQKKDILIKVAQARVHCDKPETLRAAALRTVRHTSPLKLTDWASEVKQIGHDRVFFLKCQVQNQMNQAITVLEGWVRFRNGKGEEIHAVPFEPDAVLVAGETINVRDRYAVADGRPSFNRGWARAELDIRRIRIEDAGEVAY